MSADLAEPLATRCCAHLLASVRGPYCARDLPGAGCGPTCPGYQGRLLDVAPPGAKPTLGALNLTHEQCTRAAAWQRAMRRHHRMHAA